VSTSLFADHGPARGTFAAVGVIVSIQVLWFIRCHYVFKGKHYAKKVQSVRDGLFETLFFTLVGYNLYPMFLTTVTLHKLVM